MSAEPLRNHAILIVEDDQELRILLGEVLGRAGYSTVVAENGEAALEVLRKATVLPCLIMLDLRLPRMDGYEFRARQLADPALSAIPVVLCSAEGDLAAHGRAIGAVAELSKPFNVPELVSVVGLLGRRAD